MNLIISFYDENLFCYYLQSLEMYMVLFHRELMCQKLEIFPFARIKGMTENARHEIFPRDTIIFKEKCIQELEGVLHSARV